MAELTRLWNLDPLRVPHYGPPTHAMQMFRYVEEGSIRMLWATGSPAPAPTASAPVAGSAVPPTAGGGAGEEPHAYPEESR
ncbi:hypothetical protein [Streptomyces sp. NPDC019224]|uniref:hypothetical protein n=1 Tax=Streptomyces sp. NPDC019224 TaxID=3154484 RepID=UPI003408460D